MQIVDANVLLYAVNRSGPNHEAARGWLDGSLGGTEPVGFDWTVVLAFLRLSTHPTIFPRPLTPDQATSTVGEWLAQPAALVVQPGSRHLELLAELLSETGTAAGLVGDAHLAALAIEHNGTIVSFDTDFARFKRLRRYRPGE